MTRALHLKKLCAVFLTSIILACSFVTLGHFHSSLSNDKASYSASHGSHSEHCSTCDFLSSGKSGGIISVFSTIFLSPDYGIISTKSISRPYDPQNVVHSRAPPSFTFSL